MLHPHLLYYLAAPYSHPSAAIELLRFEGINVAAARLISRNILIYSPISHSHPIKVASTALSGSWEQWAVLNRLMIDKCDCLLILPLPGWEQSVGVKYEIAYAKSTSKPVYMLDPLTLQVAYVL